MLCLVALDTQRLKVAWIVEQCRISSMLDPVVYQLSYDSAPLTEGVLHELGHAELAPPGGLVEGVVLRLAGILKSACFGQVLVA